MKSRFLNSTGNPYANRSKTVEIYNLVKRQVIFHIHRQGNRTQEP
jgi:hypothetical protein